MKAGYEDIFSQGAGGMEEGGDDFTAMFEGGEEGMEEDDGLMRSLLDMGYDVSPEKLDQIKAILETPEEGAGMDMGADMGMDAGMTSSPVEMTREGAKTKI